MKEGMMKEDISREQKEKALARLNRACLHAEKHGDAQARADYYVQITEYQEWFKRSGIDVYVQGNGYAFTPCPQASTTQMERHRIVVDGEIVYEGDDRHMAFYILLTYTDDDRPNSVLTQRLRQTVPVGTDPQTLTWDWTIQGADHANAAEGEAQ